MVMTVLAIKTGILDAHIEAAGEAEGHERFRWQIDRLSFRDDLRARAAGRANRGADCGALAPTGDRTQDGAKQRAAADVHRRVLVRTDRASSGFDATRCPDRALIGLHGIPLTIHGD